MIRREEDFFRADARARVPPGARTNRGFSRRRGGGGEGCVDAGGGWWRQYRRVSFVAFFSSSLGLLKLIASLSSPVLACCV